MYSFKTEHRYLENGFEAVIGIDEAGRGPLAGPVVAASFLFSLPPEQFKSLLGVDDSKRVTEKKRQYIYDTLTKDFKGHFSYAVVNQGDIDEINILQATFLAMKNSVDTLNKPGGSILLVDGNRKIPGLSLPQEAYVKGDSKIFSIAAASIVAKVVRDKIMLELDEAYPQYGFAKNKGYGTREHLSALRKHGPSPVHRLTFAPIKDFI
ncbi:ribonuclease HII [Candidatus Falkowbacteria bacterium]|nr:ribonuclease HII [Candidatus Falkowbacteria bacterium]